MTLFYSCVPSNKYEKGKRTTTKSNSLINSFQIAFDKKDTNALRPKKKEQSTIPGPSNKTNKTNIK